MHHDPKPETHLRWERAPFHVSTDPSLLQVGRIHAFLKESYWAKGIPLELVRKAIRGSLNFGVYEGERQVGFARVVTDRATFAYLADVYVEEPWRGKGLSKWLVECVMSHPELQGLRRWCLGTKDAHTLYEKFGFKVVSDPSKWMEIRVPDIYLRT